MTNARDVARAGAAALLLVLAAACGESASAGTATTGTVSVLLVQQAASAEFDLDRGTLTLSGVDDETLWFTDRPAHSAGTERTSYAVDEYLSDLTADGADAPNAALVWGDEPIARAVAVEIRDASFDDATNSIVYDVEVLTDGPEGFDAYGDVGEAPSGEVEDVHLFIDNLVTNVAVCDLLVLNKSVEPFQVSRSDTHHPGETIPPGTGLGIHVADAFSCSGSIHMTGLDSGATLRIVYHNPEAGADHVHMRCTGPITCTADRTRNGLALAETFVITGGSTTGVGESGPSISDAVIRDDVETDGDSVPDTAPPATPETDPTAPPTTD